MEDERRRFWRWVPARDEAGGGAAPRELEIRGTVSDGTWLDDDVTPARFRAELAEAEGDITVWINSPGGDCVAASEIYTMLLERPGKVTVKIDGIAASAASVIAMAGDEVLMSPTAMMMVHNPVTAAAGDTEDMRKAIALLSEVKEGIVSAYVRKTGLGRAKVSRLMDAETWMSAGKAVELGFADGLLGGGRDAEPWAWQGKSTEEALLRKAAALAAGERGVPYRALLMRLESIKGGR